jgi:Mob1/phocein family
MSFFNTIGFVHAFHSTESPNIFSRRSMTRAQRPKRTPTPTSATFPPQETLTSPVVSTPPPAPSKPLYLCSPFVEAALVKGNFKTIVMLPKYVDIMEWVAVNSTFIPCRGLINFDFSSFRFLHQSQRVLWRRSGTLYQAELSNDVGRRSVRPCFHYFMIVNDVLG